MEDLRHNSAVRHPLRGPCRGSGSVAAFKITVSAFPLVTVRCGFSRIVRALVDYPVVTQRDMSMNSCGCSESLMGAVRTACGLATCWVSINNHS